jgi:S-formylglutathione hydrolase FrmB
MKSDFKAVLIRPDSYKKTKASYPVVYLLHGYDGRYSDWIKKVPELKSYVDQFQIIIVCPDGHKSSWYFDSPIDSTMRYETYVGIEVPAYIDKTYRTLKDRKTRAITGLSMGGHGGIFLGLKHKETFGGIGSMSGGFDLYASRNRYDISKRIGDTVNYRQNWIDYSVLGMIEKYKVEDTRIMIDCGVDDFFYPANKLLHEKMVKLKIPHEYIERPGNHSWTYWTNAVKYQLFYFTECFKEASTRLR